MESSGWQTRDERLVVIGGGQAAAQIIDEARRRGYEGGITLVSEEAVLPYQRPPLSKQYLTGLHDQDWLLYRHRSFYERYAVDVRLGRRATAIDRAAQSVTLDDRTVLPYDKLAIATGTRSRLLDLPGADLPNIFSIRTLDDVDRLRVRLAESRSAVIIGGGFIGLETAAMLVQSGLDVTLLAASDRLIPKLVDGEMAGFLLDQHLMHGVSIVLRAEVAELRPLADGAVVVKLADGRVFAGDMVLVGIGAIPNVELAQAAGVECDNGIVVDELARTNDPNIVAAGDCTNHPNPLTGKRLRLETVHNAVEQGRTAGATIAGHELPYIQSPWVWSDQYKLRLQSVGVSEGYDRTVLRGKPADGRFSLFYYRGEDLLAVNCINQPLVFGAVRRILNERIPLHPDEAADPGFDLTRLPLPTATLDFDIPWPSKFEKEQTLVEWGFE
ncbi:FAD-dependent oxidoreductase [Sphingobium sp.]|uniref:NAD(P)/FAD-dependent oxidoreductase n=1 Tax=Sphingobium sp. TaxID=1912891 RepID=UPI0028BEB2FA|nr:FAD-dependent oxidoreductase [Sphingobium sp.]